jgi:predicted deacylase
MAREFTVGTARSTGPGKTTGYLKIGDAPDGSPLNTPVVILQGEADGQVMWMHGCVHGHEFCGTYIIHETLRTVAPKDLKGTIIALPMLNISAAQHRQRMSPFEYYHGGDMNRNFPGDPNGTLTQQMVHVIYSELKKHADILIDFHTASTPDVRWALYPAVGGKVEETSSRLARGFGYRDTLPAKPPLLTGSAMMTAAADGIAVYLVECGGKVGAFTTEAVMDGAERMRNAMRAVGMLPGPVTSYGVMYNFSTFAWITVDRGGLFQRSVKCGDRLEKGTVLGRFWDVYGNELAPALSPHPGIVLAINPGPVTGSGDTLVHIGLDPVEV